jgi:hypothetical protein
MIDIKINSINNDMTFHCKFLQNCNPDTKHVTVGDLRKMMRSRQQDTPPAVAAPPPAETIEVPVYKDPPLNPISPGGGRNLYMRRKPATVTFQNTMPFW